MTNRSGISWSRVVGVVCENSAAHTMEATSVEYCCPPKVSIFLCNVNEFQPVDIENPLLRGVSFNHSDDEGQLCRTIMSSSFASYKK